MFGYQKLMLKHQLLALSFILNLVFMVLRFSLTLSLLHHFFSPFIYLLSVFWYLCFIICLRQTDLKKLCFICGSYEFSNFRHFSFNTMGLGSIIQSVAMVLFGWNVSSCGDIIYHSHIILEALCILCLYMLCY
jgi:hypothetical protein